MLSPKLILKIRCIQYVSCLAFSALLGHSQSISAQLAEDRLADFRWFDNLDYPKFSDCQFVKVATRQIGMMTDQVVVSNDHGFLLSESGAEFVFVNTRLQTKKLNKSKPEAPEIEKVGFENSSLVDYCQTFLNDFKKRKGKDDRFDRWGGSEILSSSGEAFVLARACFQQMKPKLAKQMLQVAKELSDQGHLKLGTVSLRDGLKIDLPKCAMSYAFWKFRTLDSPNAEILNDLKRVKRNFPKCKQIDQINAATLQLEKMVAEDIAYKKPEEFSKLSKAEQVADLIYRLRNQHGVQISSPGFCDIFHRDDYPTQNELASGVVPSPAAQLIGMDLDAVPQLIDVIDDERFTRSVQGLSYVQNVLRVGDCAELIVSRIAGRSFYNDYPGYLIHEGNGKKCKANVLAWWNEVKTKGEKQVLIEGVEKGNENSVAQALRLTKRFPHVAIRPIVKGYNTSEDPWVKNWMVRIAGELGESSVDFLRKEMTSSKDVAIRCTAAIGLRKHSPDEAIAAMMIEWNKIADALKKNPTSWYHDDESDFDAPIMFFIESNDLRTAKIMTEEFAQKPWVRKYLIGKIIFDFSEAFDPPLRHKDWDQIPEYSNEVKAEIERLLVIGLSDKSLSSPEERDELDQTGPDKDTTATELPWRVCEESLDALATCFGNEYEFEDTSDSSKRETQRQKAILYWRNKTGKRSKVR